MHTYLPLNTSQRCCFVCFAYLLFNFIHLVWLLVACSRRVRLWCWEITSWIESSFICYRGSPTAAPCPKAEVVSILPLQTDIDAPSSFIDWSRGDAQSSNSNQTHAREPFLAHEHTRHAFCPVTEQRWNAGGLASGGCTTPGGWRACPHGHLSRQLD